MKILNGNIVRVNLTTGRIEREKTAGYLDRFPGGRGLNQYLLFREIPPGTAPFDPENTIVFGAGLLTGTGAPGASRLSIDSLNAFTGGIGSSNVGGNFASRLRAAGIDQLVITGRSPRPVYLWIDDGEVEFRSAECLKGKETGETERLIKEELGEGVEILSIGPAGENLVRPSSIMVNAARAAARCGLGAVLGSKKLKAVAVRGSGEVEPADPAGFREKVRELNEKLKSNPFNQKRMKYGVYCYEPWVDETPYRNFQGGRIPDRDKTEKLLPDVFLKYQEKTIGCDSCTINCWGIYHFEDEGGDKGLASSEALQGNSPHNFGAKLNIFDARAVLTGHELCNQLGLDEDNACGVLAWAFECYQRGLLTTAETDGLELEWGNAGAVFSLLKKMAYREGFGEILAEGSERAALLLGRGGEYSINIKGQDLMESLRSSVSWALGTAVAARGGTHTRGAVIEGRLQNLEPDRCRETFGLEGVGRPDSYQGKERLVYFFERLEAALDCLGLCMFTNSLRVDMLMPDDYAALFTLATGREISGEKLLQLGERVHTMEKAFNVLHRGWTRAHDYPPERFFAEPIVNGPMEGQSLDREKWKSLLTDYYRIHGWDPETGWPRKETLLRHGLEEAAAKLAEYHRLPE